MTECEEEPQKKIIGERNRRRRWSESNALFHDVTPAEGDVTPVSSLGEIVHADSREYFTSSSNDDVYLLNELVSSTTLQRNDRGDDEELVESINLLPSKLSFEQDDNDHGDDQATNGTKAKKKRSTSSIPALTNNLRLKPRMCRSTISASVNDVRRRRRNSLDRSSSEERNEPTMISRAATRGQKRGESTNLRRRFSNSVNCVYSDERRPCSENGLRSKTATLNSISTPCLISTWRQNDYSHVKSKVKQYIEQCQLQDRDRKQQSQSQLELARVSSTDSDVTDQIQDIDTVVAQLQEEQKVRKQKERELAELQSDYDELITRFAKAEVVIDRLRFVSGHQQKKASSSVLVDVKQGKSEPNCSLSNVSTAAAPDHTHKCDSQVELLQSKSSPRLPLNNTTDVSVVIDSSMVVNDDEQCGTVKEVDRFFSFNDLDGDEGEKEGNLISSKSNASSDQSDKCIQNDVVGKEDCLIRKDDVRKKNDKDLFNTEVILSSDEIDKDTEGQITEIDNEERESNQLNENNCDVVNIEREEANSRQLIDKAKQLKSDVAKCLGRMTKDSSKDKWNSILNDYVSFLVMVNQSKSFQNEQLGEALRELAERIEFGVAECGIREERRSVCSPRDENDDVASSVYKIPLLNDTVDDNGDKNVKKTTVTTSMNNVIANSVERKEDNEEERTCGQTLKRAQLVIKVNVIKNKKKYDEKLVHHKSMSLNHSEMNGLNDSTSKYDEVDTEKNKISFSSIRSSRRLKSGDSQTNVVSRTISKEESDILVPLSDTDTVKNRNYSDSRNVSHSPATSGDGKRVVRKKEKNRRKRCSSDGVKKQSLDKGRLSDSIGHVDVSDTEESHYIRKKSLECLDTLSTKEKVEQWQARLCSVSPRPSDCLLPHNHYPSVPREHCCHLSDELYFSQERLFDDIGMFDTPRSVNTRVIDHRRRCQREQDSGFPADSDCLANVHIGHRDRLKSLRCGGIDSASWSSRTPVRLDTDPEIQYDPNRSLTALAHVVFDLRNRFNELTRSRSAVVIGDPNLSQQSDCTSDTSLNSSSNAAGLRGGSSQRYLRRKFLQSKSDHLQLLPDRYDDYRRCRRSDRWDINYPRRRSLTRNVGHREQASQTLLQPNRHETAQLSEGDTSVGLSSTTYSSAENTSVVHTNVVNHKYELHELERKVDTLFKLITEDANNKGRPKVQESPLELATHLAAKVNDFSHKLCSQYKKGNNDAVS